MEYTNSFFRLFMSERGVMMRVYPAQNGGEKLNIDEVLEYLRQQKVEDFDIKVINDTINKATEVTDVRISTKTTYEIDEKMDVKITPDKMYAIVKFYAPSGNGDNLSEEEIIAELRDKKVTHGILDVIVKKHVDDPEYCKNMIIAKGIPAINGHDAEIEYKFNTDRKAKPRLNEDGTVDFHQLDNINHVKKGDVLAVLTPEDHGTPGTDVCGGVIPPVKVKRLVLKHGNNIELSEDKCEMYSMVDGHVILEGDRVFVSNNYDVGADVDTSTGDISYNGSVTVMGNVRTGFAIKAEGNVEVFGVVEGAEIEAGGDVILHRGIQGMSKGIIRAKGNVLSKFIESANVIADGYIETDSLLHSDISAKGDIYVRGKNGSIIGGNTRSSVLIEAATIGSPMGTTTVVEVGTDPAVKDRVNYLKQTISTKTDEKEKLDKVLLALRKKKELGILEEEKVPLIASTTKTVVMLDSEVKTMTKEYETLQGELETNKSAMIKVKKDIFPGTKVAISEDYILIHEKNCHCIYKKDRAEIKATPY